MKQFMLFVAIVVAVATPSFVQAQETETISFVNQIGCELSYKIVDLADIVATSDTLVDDDEVIRLMSQYEDEFPSDLGPDEPAVAVLEPDDSFFNVIFLQQTEGGDILTIRILTSDGWIECVDEPGSKSLLALAGMILHIQHQDAVSM